MLEQQLDLLQVVLRSDQLTSRELARAEAAVADRTIRARLTRLSGLHGVFQPALSDLIVFISEYDQQFSETGVKDL